MKKFIIMGAAALLGTFGADAATKYVVWSGDDLTADEVQIPAIYNDWWKMTNTTEDDATSTEGKAWKFASIDGTADASCGYQVNYENAPETFDLSLIKDCDLVFNAKIVGQGEWLIRLTTPAADGKIEIPADGEYHEVRFHVPTVYAGIMNHWTNTPNNQAFVFSPIGTKLTAESALMVNDVRYETHIPIPAITASATDITSNSAKLTYSVEFAEGYSNTTVTVNGENHQTSGTLDLTGLTPKTEYTYTIKATGEYEGKTYSAEKVVTFKTAREAGDLPVWYGRTDKEGFTADYSITYNADKTLTIQAEFDTETPIVEADHNFHIYINGDEWIKLYASADNTGVRYATSTKTYEEGAELTWEWYLVKEGGGLYQETNTYVVGSENEKPADLPRLEAKVEEVTFNSAKIAYSVKNAADFTNIVVKMDGKTVTASPVSLTNLTENTEYTYTFSVTGEKDGETLAGKDVKVTFKTPRENAVDLVYADYVKAELKNAYLIGETADDARTFYVSLPFQVTYTALGTGKYEIDLSQVEGIVGLVPQIYWNGFQTLSKNAETGMYEYDFGQQEADAEVAISHYLAYSGGNLDQRSAYTKWGMEQTRPELGQPANIALSINTRDIRVDKPFIITACITDANGYYLTADNAEIAGEGVTIANDGHATVTNKGDYTVTGTCGELSSTVSFSCFINKISENLVSNMLPYAFDPFNAEDVAKNVTDGNDVTEAIWDCTNGDVHYMYFDLGEEYGVEGASMVWEGAYAVDYEIIFSLNKFGEETESALISGITGDHTITVTDNNTTHCVHPVMEGDEYSYVKARYVAVKTSKALNSGWGIKPREFKVFGSNYEVIAGVENIEMENSDAPVEYYTLQGIRVAEPVSGLYIRRQGNTSTKVLVK